MATGENAQPKAAPRQFEELEELADGDLEELEPTLQIMTRTSTGRISAPPPLPLEARRSSVPPPPQSGMFRISNAPGSSVAQPPRESDPAVLEQQVQRLQLELHERTQLVDRLRLAVTMRDDRLREIERAMHKHRERADDLEKKLTSQAARVQTLESALQHREQSDHDDLRRIPGIGPVFARKLEQHGIRRFEQLAALDAAGVAGIADALGIPVQRIERGAWLAKAAELAAQKQTAVAG